ncbi:MAG: DUF3822 family protein [Cyclobacteriaceae bacterium]|nr:MAG: DUF3822 family protein [Cyclobacteriaceae bacterium]
MQNVATFKLIKKIKDDRFEEDNIHEYSLLLNVGPRDVQVGVVDGNQNRLLYLEDYVLPSVSSSDDLIYTLEQLFDYHAFIRAGFWKRIKIALKNQKLVQVPQALFDESAVQEYLKLNAQPSAQEETAFIPMEKSEAVTVFAIQKELKTWVEQKYPQKQFTLLHQSAALIEGVMRIAEKRTDNPLYLYVDRFKLHIISVNQGKLVYYNQFTILSFQDYIRYIMLVMKTLNMDQQTSNVVMWGYIGKNSPHYHEFYKYIQNVTFGERPDNLKFGYMFDEVQDHHFIDLYSVDLFQ